MGFLVIMERELRLAARKAITYRSRVVCALVVLSLSLGMLFSGFGGVLSPGSAGRGLFLSLTVASYVFLLFEGSLLTADCLSQEKRDGTLGLLFLTDLSGFDVVAGKLAARTWNSAYCLMATLPAPAVAIFLGGVTGMDILSSSVALLCTLFWTSSLGILTSALSRSERISSSISLGLALVFGLALPLAAFAVHSFYRFTLASPLLMLFTPASMLVAILFPSHALNHFSFFSSFMISQVVAWTCITLAALLLPRCWQEGSSRASLRVWKSHRQARRWPRGFLEINPVLWLGLRTAPGSNPMLSAIILLAFAWFFMGLSYPSRWLTIPVFAGTMLILHFLLALQFALRASRLASDDRKSGALELLLTTPLDDRTIVSGKMLAFKRRLFPTVGVVLAIDLAFLVAGCVQLEHALAWAWAGTCIFLMIQMLIDLYSLSWVGFFYGFESTTSGRAIRQTLFSVFALQWICFIVSLGVVALLTQGAAFRSPAGAVGAFCWYLLIMVMSTLHHCGAAFHALKDSLRGLAAARS